MLYIDEKLRRRGLGKELLQFWEDRMREAGCKVVMTSTQSDESAQHFYRKSGYRDAGALLLNTAALNQPTELFFIKENIISVRRFKDLRTDFYFADISICQNYSRKFITFQILKNRIPCMKCNMERSEVS